MKFMRLKLLSVGFCLLMAVFFAAPPLHAQDYSCGAYGASTYQNNNCTEDQEDDLSNTGQSILIWSSIGGLLIIAGIASFFYTSRKRSKK